MIENLQWDSSSTPLENIRPQQVLLGELSYVNIASRPDISFSVNKIARTTHKPTKETFRALKRVLKHLVATAEEGLCYKPFVEKEIVLQVFSDASFADIREEKLKSTAGFLTYLNGALIDWRSAKIKWVCTSTCTAELLGLYNAVTKTLHLAYMLKEIFDCIQSKNVE